MNLVLIKKIPKQEKCSLQPAISPIALNVILPNSTLSRKFNDHITNMTPVVFTPATRYMFSKLFVITKVISRFNCAFDKL